LYQIETELARDNFARNAKFLIQIKRYRSK